MHFSIQFPELFRKETYAVNLALVEGRQLTDVFKDTILASRPIEGVWDKEYSVVPIGELEGREEGEDIPQKNMTPGYTCYGSISNEASGKVGLTKLLKQRSKEFKAAGGGVDEPKFAGHLADTASRGFIVRRNQRFRKLASKIFNLGAIQAGNAFFNHRDRCKMSDVPDSDLIYDGCPLFAIPANAHPSYAAGATVGPGTAPVGNFVDYQMTMVDTGGYFNAFRYPPAYWALKRVVQHFCFNMQFDENDEREEDKPDTLLVSSYNAMSWIETLKSHFIEPTAAGNTTNIENIFQMEDFKMNLVASADLVRNTWYVGKAKSQGILLEEPTKEEDPWAYWRDEKDRSYWISFEDDWGFMIRNWRRWVAGAYTADGETAPTFGDIAETAWNTMPDGI